MSTSNTERIGVIADDFTGAIDAGVEFVRAGFDTTLIIAPTDGYTSQVEVINTDSRDGDASMARERAAAAATALRGRRIFKKIDSTMRGHIGDEIATMLRVLGQTKAVVCPAAIEAGRTVRDGQLWIHDLPLHQSDFARDPRWPATTATMDTLLGVPTTHIALTTVRTGAEALAATIMNAPTAVVTVDAHDHTDLDLVSQAIVLSNSMPCGALGLARAWARCQSGKTSSFSAAMSVARSGPILVVAGSRHARTHAQVQQLLLKEHVNIIEVSIPLQHQQEAVDYACASLSAGNTTVIRAPMLDIADASAQRIIVETLGDLTLRICQVIRPGGLVLTGGETASAISYRLGAMGVRILGEVEVGVPWGIVIGGIIADGLIVTKAGGFGSEDAFLKVVDVLSGMRHTA